MNRLILKRMFMLILFLDNAKRSRLIPSDPCLFNKVLDICVFPSLNTHLLLCPFLDHLHKGQTSETI